MPKPEALQETVCHCGKPDEHTLQKNGLCPMVLFGCNCNSCTPTPEASGEEKKCAECNELFENYSVIEKGPVAGGKIENPNICQECMALGWSDATISDFENDPELKGKISVLSPLSTPPTQEVHVPTCKSTSTSPTWEEREREAFEKWRTINTGKYKANDIGEYFFERIREAREEAYARGRADEIERNIQRNS